MNWKESEKQQRIRGKLDRNKIICARAKTTSHVRLGWEYGLSKQRIGQIVKRGQRPDWFRRLIKLIWGE